MPFKHKRKSLACGRGYRNNLRSNNRQKPLSVQINYQGINQACLGVIQSLLMRWLPDGKIYGHEYVALNPKRNDTKLGSFKVNIYNGKWADFATGDKGGDLISLASYLSGKSNSQSALELADMLGVQHG